MLQPMGMPPAPPPPAAMGVAPLDCHGPLPQHIQQPTPTPSNVQNMQNIETRNIQEELNQEPNSNQMPEDCQNELCCPIDQSEEAMQPPQHCSCEAVEVPCTATSSERSSSYNSCTLPLKPLKGILKKKNSQQENSGNNGPNHMREMSYSTMTLPRDILHQCHGQQLHQLEQHQLEQHQLHQQGPHAHHQHHGQFEVVPFDQVPPCDDCMQRARHRGSYGDVCQNLEIDGNCGFQMGTLQRGPPSQFKSPTHSSMSQNSIQMAPVAMGYPENNMGFCCKHDRPRQNSLIIAAPGGATHLVISRQNSFDEKEEVEAVESSV